MSFPIFPIINFQINSFIVGEHTLYYSYSFKFIDKCFKLEIFNNI